MMTCRDLYGFLDAFLEGGLDVSTLAAFEAHLSLCAACRRYLASYRESVILARGAERADDDAPAAAPVELMRAILRARAAASRPERS